MNGQVNHRVNPSSKICAGPIGVLAFVAGSIETNWHRFCVKDINILGSWAFTADDIARGIALLDRARDRYPFRDLQTRFPFSEDGIQAAIDAAGAMACVKATIVVNPEIVE